MEVIRHGELIITRFENPFKSSNSYLIQTFQSNEGWLFDIGDSPEIAAATGNIKINGLFITHAHFDHLKGIKEFYEKHPECTIYGSSHCIQWLSDDRRNLSYYYEKPLCFFPERICMVDKDDVFRLSDSSFIEFIPTPGHTEDSMTYRIGDVIITGDSYIPFVPPVTKLKGGNRHKYEESVALIKKRLTARTLLLPGHGPLYWGAQLSGN